MILIDDNFASTVNGIEEGRLIFQNLKKSIQYTVTHTMPEVWANLLYLVVPLPLPLSAVLILLVDLGFELFLALSYAWDPPENKTGLMKLLPRKPVTPDSVIRTKRIAARAAQHAERTKNMSKFGKFMDSLSKPFTAEFWAEVMEPKEEETLVDLDLLSWSYIEAGSIMTVGCFVVYFFAIWYHFKIYPSDLVKNASVWGTADSVTISTGKVLTKDEQLDALGAGQSAYYLAIMIQQCFNLFICKARLGFPFGAVMFQNAKTFLGMFCGAIFTMALVYIPPINLGLGTYWRTTPFVWLISVGFGIVLLVYSVIRLAIKRASNPIKYSKIVVGLQMHPTRWSTGK
nr:hypothetical protein HK105_004449 [Polyrhizophydium stewartii]